MNKIHCLLFASALLFACSSPDHEIDAPAIENVAEDTLKNAEEQIKEGNADQGCDASVLLGAWVSEEDDNSVLIFKSDSMVNTYKGSDEQTSASAYYLFDSVHAESGEHRCYLFASSPELGDMQYEVMGLSKNNLSLMYLVRGNMLVYKRLK